MYILYGHGGSENHGCEAIVRSTIKMSDQSVRLYSVDKNQDIRYGIDEFCEVISNKDIPIKRGSREWFFSAVQTKLTGKIDMQIQYRKKNLLEKIDKKDVYFSIGGDNYCYPGTEVLAAERNVIQKHGAKVVLWGCSVEPALLNQSQIANDLASYDLITARESLSYDALKKINPNTILVADPAFTLEKKCLSLPAGWKEGNTIGINMSPLIMHSSKDGNLVYKAYEELISEILNNTDSVIALIPHVVWQENDDRIPLLKLYSKFERSDRVILLKDCNCLELKGYISRCRLFIGARTHATIAAYSTGVPTIVLGYSVKSKGIARDLFGTYENYVLSVQDMKSSDSLMEAFRWLLDHEEEIRKRLQDIMPSYIQNAYSAIQALNNL